MKNYCLLRTAQNYLCPQQRAGDVDFLYTKLLCPFSIETEGLQKQPFCNRFKESTITFAYHLNYDEKLAPLPRFYIAHFGKY